MKRKATIGDPSCGRVITVGVAAFTAYIACVPNVSAQSGPPVRGTMALEGTMQRFYKAANVIIVKTVDGVEHAFSFTKDLLVHGGKHGIDQLADLQEGRTVIVHYSGSGKQPTAVEIDPVGDDGLQVTEGTVVRVNRARQQITIRYDNGTVETLRLTPRAAAAAGLDDDAQQVQVKVAYVNEGGEKVVHYFRRAST
jgi:hypothetical protein